MLSHHLEISMSGYCHTGIHQLFIKNISCNAKQNQLPKPTTVQPNVCCYWRCASLATHWPHHAPTHLSALWCGWHQPRHHCATTPYHPLQKFTFHSRNPILRKSKYNQPPWCTARKLICTCLSPLCPHKAPLVWQKGRGCRVVPCPHQGQHPLALKYHQPCQNGGHKSLYIMRSRAHDCWAKLCQCQQMKEDFESQEWSVRGIQL